YFVGQTEAVRLWDWIGDLLRALDLPPVRRRIPQGVAYALGAVCEGAYRVLGKQGDPPMSRFVARQLATSHSYDMGPLERALGYQEQVPLAEANRRTIAALLEQRKA
ncbi:MAG TPA: 3-beta hydroxysteroid dehydrogenase, partial [Planctomycetota bacterium]|nr:3-beta hydroxysteroid dehydrogenase [Planctomycetota bacterium]